MKQNVHHNHNLNTFNKLNTRLISRRLTELGKDKEWLAGQLMVAQLTMYTYLSYERIPSDKYFGRLTAALGLTREDLLVPLAGVKHG